MLINKEKQNTKRANKNVFLREPLTDSCSKKKNKKLKNAILKNNIMLVKEMIGQGTDINQKIIGEVKILANEVEQVDLESRFFWAPCNETTPLILAAWLGHGALVDLFVEAGAKLDEKDSRGYTALMRAAFIGDLGVGKKLANAGADIESRNKRGKTALMFASYKNHLEIVDLLLSIGANPLKKDTSKKSAYEHATMRYNSIQAFRYMRRAQMKQFQANRTLNLKNKGTSNKIKSIIAANLMSRNQKLEEEIQNIIELYNEKWGAAGKWMATEKLMKAIRKCDPEATYNIIKNI